MVAGGGYNVVVDAVGVLVGGGVKLGKITNMDTLFCIEGHIPIFTPCTNGVEVSLKI